MKSGKRQRQRKQRIWLWMLVISMLVPLLSGQPSVVHAAGAALGWKTVGIEGFSDGQANNTAIALDGDGTPYVIPSSISG